MDHEAYHFIGLIHIQRPQVLREDGTRYNYFYDAVGQLTNAAATLADNTPWQAY